MKNESHVIDSLRLFVAMCGSYRNSQGLQSSHGGSNQEHDGNEKNGLVNKNTCCVSLVLF